MPPLIPLPRRMEADAAGPEEIALPLRDRLVNLIFVVVPFAALLAATVWVWGRGFEWLELALLIGMYLITGLGVTIGFHRFFAHRSFDTGRVMQVILAILGSMAVEGPLLRWVATHRSHHHHSDKVEDPHSPHHHGSGFMNTIRGFWRAHVGWIFEPDAKDLYRYVPDLSTDRLLRTVSRLFPLWVGLSLLLPTVIAGLVTMSWTGAFFGFLWGGLVRIFFVHHITWSINSVCHIWGTRTFQSHDESRNNPIFGVLGFGEGWHNNHHAFPASARHGLKWWQLDTSYLLIQLMSLVGLVRNVRTPSPQRIRRKLLKPPS